MRAGDAARVPCFDTQLLQAFSLENAGSLKRRHASPLQSPCSLGPEWLLGVRRYIGMLEREVSTAAVPETGVRVAGDVAAEGWADNADTVPPSA